MTTTAGGTVTWITVDARCKWCDRPAHVSVTGAAGTVVRFRCADRGCKMEQEVTII